MQPSRRVTSRNLVCSERTRLSLDPLSPPSLPSPPCGSCVGRLSPPLRDPAGFAAAHKEEDPPSVLSIRRCISSVGCAVLFANKSLFTVHLAFAKRGVGGGVQFLQFNATRMPVLINGRLHSRPQDAAAVYSYLIFSIGCFSRSAATAFLFVSFHSPSTAEDASRTAVEGDRSRFFRRLNRRIVSESSCSKRNQSPVFDISVTRAKVHAWNSGCVIALIVSLNNPANRRPIAQQRKGSGIAFQSHPQG